MNVISLSLISNNYNDKTIIVLYIKRLYIKRLLYNFKIEVNIDQ